MTKQFRYVYPYADMSSAAAGGLKMVGSQAVDPLLEFISKCKEEHSLAAALGVLGALGDPRAIPPLAAALHCQ